MGLLYDTILQTTLTFSYHFLHELFKFESFNGDLPHPSPPGTFYILHITNFILIDLEIYSQACFTFESYPDAWIHILIIKFQLIFPRSKCLG